MKDIKGYEGLYAITSCGKVWSYRKNRFLKQYTTPKGYKTIQLWDNGRFVTRKIHRLVAETYIPNQEKLDTVDHINFDKENNCINNLRWMSRGENSVRKRCL